MKFDELKDVWQNQSENSESFQANLIEKLKTKNPLEKIKTVMKWELYSTWIVIAGLICYLILNPIKDKGMLISVYLATNLTVITTIYYHILFYTFYKKRLNVASNSFMNLVEFLAEFRVNLHLYRSYNYVLIILVIPILLVYKFRNLLLHFSQSSTDILALIIIITAISIFLVIIFCEIWIYFFYGKYLKRIAEIKEQFYN